MNDLDAGGMSFGGFSLGGLQLALPMSALREVVSCSALTDLPCPAKCVIGGISLRGMVIPVVDLRIVLGRTASAGEGRNVVIIAHGDNLMGLLADSLTGLFEGIPGSFKRTIVSDATAAIFLASVQRSDNHEMVSVLSTDALSGLHQVPMVEEIEPTRERRREVDGVDEARDSSVPMLLLTCNGIPFAIEAIVVHATLSNPPVEIAELTSLDVITYDGTKVPVLDLLELCRLGRLDRTGNIQALVVSLPEGYIALLISAVVDVIRTRADDVKKLPAFALARPGLFVGSLPVSALPAELAGRAGASVNQYLVIDPAELKACDEVLSLARLNVPASGESTGPKALSDTGSAVRGRRSMITYMLETERASPLEQVLEILSYQPGTELFRTSGPMLGLMVNRGRSIPVLCLGQASGEACGPPTPSSRVLVVESGGELIGFSVRKLNSIEEADWEPTVPVAAELGGMRNNQPRKLALFASRRTDRMLPILDLLGIAESLQRAPLLRLAQTPAE